MQRVRRRDGEYRTFSVHAVPVTDERGHLVEWVGSHTDITEQREAEQRVRESVRRLELALDASSVGMWDWDLESDRMIWTRQTHLITGIPAAETATPSRMPPKKVNSAMLSDTAMPRMASA